MAFGINKTLKNKDIESQLSSFDNVRDIETSYSQSELDRLKTLETELDLNYTKFDIVAENIFDYLAGNEQDKSLLQMIYSSNLSAASGRFVQYLEDLDAEIEADRITARELGEKFQLDANLVSKLDDLLDIMIEEFKKNDIELVTGATTELLHSFGSELQFEYELWTSKENFSSLQIGAFNRGAVNSAHFSSGASIVVNGTNVSLSNFINQVSSGRNQYSLVSYDVDGELPHDPYRFSSLVLTSVPVGGSPESPTFSDTDFYGDEDVTAVETDYGYHPDVVYESFSEDEPLLRAPRSGNARRLDRESYYMSSTEDPECLVDPETGMPACDQLINPADNNGVRFAPIYYMQQWTGNEFMELYTGEDISQSEIREYYRVAEYYRDSVGVRRRGIVDIYRDKNRDQRRAARNILNANLNRLRHDADVGRRHVDVDWDKADEVFHRFLADLNFDQEDYRLKYYGDGTTEGKRDIYASWGSAHRTSLRGIIYRTIRHLEREGVTDYKKIRKELKKNLRKYVKNLFDKVGYDSGGDVGDFAWMFAESLISDDLLIAFERIVDLGDVTDPAKQSIGLGTGANAQMLLQSRVSTDPDETKRRGGREIPKLVPLDENDPNSEYLISDEGVLAFICDYDSNFGVNSMNETNRDGVEKSGKAKSGKERDTGAAMGRALYENMMLHCNTQAHDLDPNQVGAEKFTAVDGPKTGYVLDKLIEVAYHETDNPFLKTTIEEKWKGEYQNYGVTTPGGGFYYTMEGFSRFLRNECDPSIFDIKGWVIKTANQLNAARDMSEIFMTEHQRSLRLEQTAPTMIDDITGVCRQKLDALSRYFDSDDERLYVRQKASFAVMKVANFITDAIFVSIDQIANISNMDATQVINDLFRGAAWGGLRYTFNQLLDDNARNHINMRELKGRMGQFIAQILNVNVGVGMGSDGEPVAGLRLGYENLFGKLFGPEKVDEINLKYGNKFSADLQSAFSFGDGRPFYLGLGVGVSTLLNRGDVVDMRSEVVPMERIGFRPSLGINFQTEGLTWSSLWESIKEFDPRLTFAYERDHEAMIEQQGELVNGILKGVFGYGARGTRDEIYPGLQTAYQSGGTAYQVIERYLTTTLAAFKNTPAGREYMAANGASILQAPAAEILEAFDWLGFDNWSVNPGDPAQLEEFVDMVHHTFIAAQKGQHERGMQHDYEKLAAKGVVLSEVGFTFGLREIFKLAKGMANLSGPPVVSQVLGALQFVGSVFHLKFSSYRNYYRENAEKSMRIANMMSNGEGFVEKMIFDETTLAQQAEELELQLRVPNLDVSVDNGRLVFQGAGIQALNILMSTDAYDSVLNDGRSNPVLDDNQIYYDGSKLVLGTGQLSVGQWIRRDKREVFLYVGGSSSPLHSQKVNYMSPLGVESRVQAIENRDTVTENFSQTQVHENFSNLNYYTQTVADLDIPVVVKADIEHQIQDWIFNNVGASGLGNNVSFTFDMDPSGTSVTMQPNVIQTPVVPGQPLKFTITVRDPNGGTSTVEVVPDSFEDISWSSTSLLSSDIEAVRTSLDSFADSHREDILWRVERYKRTKIVEFYQATVASDDLARAVGVLRSIMRGVDGFASIDAILTGNDDTKKQYIVTQFKALFAVSFNSVTKFDDGLRSEWSALTDPDDRRKRNNATRRVGEILAFNGRDRTFDKIVEDEFSSLTLQNDFSSQGEYRNAVRDQVTNMVDYDMEEISNGVAIPAFYRTRNKGFDVTLGAHKIARVGKKVENSQHTAGLFDWYRNKLTQSPWEFGLIKDQIVDYLKQETDCDCTISSVEDLKKIVMEGFMTSEGITIKIESFFEYTIMAECCNQMIVWRIGGIKKTETRVVTHGAQSVFEHSEDLPTHQEGGLDVTLGYANSSYNVVSQRRDFTVAAGLDKITPPDRDPVTDPDGGPPDRGPVTDPDGDDPPGPPPRNPITDPDGDGPP